MRGYLLVVVALLFVWASAAPAMGSGARALLKRWLALPEQWKEDVRRCPVFKEYGPYPIDVEFWLASVGSGVVPLSLREQAMWPGLYNLLDEHVSQAERGMRVLREQAALWAAGVK